MYEIAICEVCKRTFRKDTMQGAHGNICADCAKPLPTPPKVDFYDLADEPDAIKPKPRVCVDCGAHYLGCGASRYCPACRIRREKEASARQAAKRKAEKGMPKADPVCQICGKPLPNHRYTYCADCAEKRSAERMAAWRQAHKDDINAAQRAKYHARKAKEANDAEQA